MTADPLTAADLAAHELRAARAEYDYAAALIADGGVARFWHPRTGLRLLATRGALDAFFAATRQRL